MKQQDALVVHGQPMEKYHASLDSVGISGLSQLNKTPLHHWYLTRRPNRGPEIETDAQRIGTAIHMAVLEPERFRESYAFFPKCDRRTKAGKEIYEAAMSKAGERSMLKQDEYDCAVAVAQQVRSHPLAKILLEGPGWRESSIYWTDKETGIRCRMRPDFAPDNEAVLVDLKSTTDASEAYFPGSAWRLGYHLTAAWYLDGWKALTGKKREYVFAAWEKEPPFACAFYVAQDDTVESGRATCRRLLRLYADCLAKDQWPGYAPMLMPFYPPAWATNE